jgi:hypothetical protein
LQEIPGIARDSAQFPALVAAAVAARWVLFGQGRRGPATGEGTTRVATSDPAEPTTSGDAPARLGALDRAAKPERARGPAAAVARAVERILDAGIDGRGPLESAQQVADRARAATSDPEAAIDRVVRNHLAIGAGGGLVTGMGGFVTLPLALPANVAEFYLTATRMVAAIASIRGYDLGQDQVRAAVLLTIVGAESEDLLKKAGVAQPRGRMTGLVTSRLPGPALMVVNKALAFRVVNQVLRGTLSWTGKIVPVVGGAVGAGLDTYLLKRIADQARQEFPPR